MGSQSLSGWGGNTPYALAPGAADGGNNYVGRTALV